MLVALYNSAPLAQSVEHQTFNLRVVGSSPTRGYMSLGQTLNDTIRTYSNFFLHIKPDVVGSKPTQTDVC